MNPIDLIEIDEYKPWLSRRVPKGYWEIERNRLMAIKWLFQEQLQWDDEQIKKDLTNEIIAKNGLSSLVRILGGRFEMVRLYTNGRIKPWEMKKTPKDFFDEPQNRIKALRWLIDEKLKWTREDIIQHFDGSVLRENGLSSLYKSKSSYYELLNEAYPGQFYAWEVMESVPDGFWENRSNRVKAVYWLMGKLDMEVEDFLKNVTNKDVFLKHNLITVYTQYNNMDRLKEDLFPGSMELLRQKTSEEELEKEMRRKTHHPMQGIEIPEEKPWLNGRVPMGYWNEETNRLGAIKWLFEEALGWNDEQIKEKFTVKIVMEHHLYSLIDGDGNLYELVRLYTDGQIKPWEMKKTPRGFFDNPENCKEAIRWLVEEKLQWTDQEIIKKLNAKIFNEYRLNSLYKQYKTSYDLIESVYPGRFQAWEVMGSVPHGFWEDRNNRVKAVYWLLNKLELTVDEFLIQVTNIKPFLKHNLSSVYLFYKNMKELKEDLFPGSMEILRQQKRIN